MSLKFLGNHRVKGTGSIESNSPEKSGFETLSNLEEIWVRVMWLKVFSIQLPPKQCDAKCYLGTDLDFYVTDELQ